MNGIGRNSCNRNTSIQRLVAVTVTVVVFLAVGASAWTCERCNDTGVVEQWDADARRYRTRDAAAWRAQQLNRPERDAFHSRLGLNSMTGGTIGGIDSRNPVWIPVHLRGGWAACRGGPKQYYCPCPIGQRRQREAEQAENERRARVAAARREEQKREEERRKQEEAERRVREREEAARQEMEERTLSQVWSKLEKALTPAGKVRYDKSLKELLPMAKYAAGAMDLLARDIGQVRYRQQLIQKYRGSNSRLVLDFVKSKELADFIAKFGDKDAQTLQRALTKGMDAAVKMASAWREAEKKGRHFTGTAQEGEIDGWSETADAALKSLTERSRLLTKHLARHLRELKGKAPVKARLPLSTCGLGLD